MLRKLIILFLGVPLGLGALGIYSSQAESETKMAQAVRCNPLGNTLEIKKCAEEKYAAADQRLNQVYQGMLAQLNEVQKQRLINAQRAWIDFRDKTCSFEAAEASGGTLEDVLLKNCLARVTEERTKGLETYQANRPNTPPPPSNNPSSIANLPDGNYRYTTAKFSQFNITDEELVKAGGYYFLFQKTGNKITGYLNQVDSENTICVNGTITGNTVTGQAIETIEAPQRVPTIKSTGDTFVPWDLMGGSLLKVRRGKKVGNKIQYDSVILNLSGLNRVNAGSQAPPNRC